MKHNCVIISIPNPNNVFLRSVSHRILLDYRASTYFPLGGPGHATPPTTNTPQLRKMFNIFKVNAAIWYLVIA